MEIQKKPVNKNLHAFSQVSLDGSYINMVINNDLGFLAS